MFRRGVSKEAIRKMLGHHSWDFTASTYLHLNDDDLPDTQFFDALDERHEFALPIAESAVL